MDDIAMIFAGAALLAFRLWGYYQMIPRGR